MFFQSIFGATTQLLGSEASEELLIGNASVASDDRRQAKELASLVEKLRVRRDMTSEELDRANDFVKCPIARQARNARVAKLSNLSALTVND